MEVLAILFTVWLKPGDFFYQWICNAIKIWNGVIDFTGNNPGRMYEYKTFKYYVFQRVLEIKSV